MKKVYIIFEGDGLLVHKVFTSRQFADKYMEEIPTTDLDYYSEPEEYEVEQ